MAVALNLSSLFIATAFFAAFVTSCTGTTSTVNEPITKIVYRFQDASVPPQYHRSYTITATRDLAHIVVDSYGDVLADEIVDINEHKMRNVIAFFEQCRIKQTAYEKDRASCTGGASKSLTVYSDENILLDGIAYHCEGRVEGSLSGDIDSFTKALEDLIPDFSNLVQ